MNVLLFVTTMIMVLAMLTYAKLETYRNFSLLQSQFTRYMEKTERSYINAAAKSWYENSVATKKTAPKGNQKTRVQARSRLSFITLIDKTKQAQYAQAYPKIVLLTKKLMTVLYQDQPFFKQAIQQQPDILDLLLASLMPASEALPKEQKIKKASELASLDLGDRPLNAFFYHILKGSPAPIEEDKPQVQPVEKMPELILKSPEGEPDDEGGDPDKKQEYLSPEGYVSLLDYITVEDSAKIRVFLAARPLLIAIYDNMELVNGIIAMREDLYKRLSNNTISAQEASEQFKNAFLTKSDPNFDESILDFTVTKTNPRNYE